MNVVLGAEMGRAGRAGGAQHPVKGCHLGFLVRTLVRAVFLL